MSDNTVDTTETSKLAAIKAKAKAALEISKTPLVKAAIFTSGCVFGTYMVRDRIDKYLHEIVDENSDTDE